MPVRQILASSLISTDPPSASCEYHGLLAKKIQLIQSIMLITDALPVTPYSRVLSLMSCYYEVPSLMASYSLSTSLDNNKSKHHMQPVYSSYIHAGGGEETYFLSQYQLAKTAAA